MADTIRFTATKLSANKRGVLSPDANGYYDICLGALNVFNSAGEYYTLKGAEELFQQSSSFMRRIANGCLKSEVDHPKPTPSMSDEDFLRRILSIDGNNVCAHIKEVRLEPVGGKDGLVLIMGKVKPAGPKGQPLKEAFENPDENVCFSIRALTKDYRVGRTNYRVLHHIETFDWVTEPGIHTANKWDSPSLETISEHIIAKRHLVNLVNIKPMGSVSLEASQASAIEALNSIERAVKLEPPPYYTKW